MWFKYGLKAQKLLAQGVWGLHDSYCPLPLLYPSASDFQFPSAGNRWFRACGQNLRKFSNLSNHHEFIVV